MQNKKVYLPMRRAFTLIELLIVIAIIGILAGVVLVSTNSARQKARDSQRKSDVNSIAKALHMHWVSSGEYNITSDCVGTPHGYGYINSPYTCSQSVNEILVAKGFFSKPINDPTNPTGFAYNYMLASCAGGKKWAVYAVLENPTTETDKTMEKALAPPYNCTRYADDRFGFPGSYYANYAVIVE